MPSGHRTTSATAAVAAGSDTASRILDAAEDLVQTRGFNGFSYADIAGVVGVTKASLHYHFPSKARLGEVLIQRYTASFLGALARIDQNGRDAGEKLRMYVGIWAGVLARKKMCLCGMLAADYVTLPEEMKYEVRRFFEGNDAWLVELLGRGRAAKELTFAGAPVDFARVLVATLEGAMLLARPHDDPARLRSAADYLLAGLSAPAVSLKPAPERVRPARALKRDSPYPPIRTLSLNSPSCQSGP